MCDGSSPWRVDVALDAFSMRGSLAMALTIDVLGPLSACGVTERAQRGEWSRVRVVVPDSWDPTCKDTWKRAVT